MDELQQKRLFAQKLLEGDEPFKIATSFYPENVNRALFIASNWPNDVDVLQIIADLKNEKGEESFLPTKTEFLKRLWSDMDSCFEEETRVKYAKLYAETRGFIEKPQTNVEINQNRIVNVMRVPQRQSLDDYERTALEQQTKLITDATRNTN